MLTAFCDESLELAHSPSAGVFIPTAATPVLVRCRVHIAAPPLWCRVQRHQQPCHYTVVERQSARADMSHRSADGSAPKVEVLPLHCYFQVGGHTHLKVTVIITALG